MTTHLEIAIEVQADGGLIRSVEVTEPAVRGVAPGWQKGVPQRDGWYWFRSSPERDVEMVEIRGPYQHGLTSGQDRSLRWLAANRPQAAWAPVPTPGESLPVAVDWRSLPEREREFLEGEAQGKNLEICLAIIK